MLNLLDELEKMKRESIYKREQAVVENFKKIMKYLKKSKRKHFKHLTVVK